MIRTWIAEVTPLLEESVYRKCYEKLPTFRKEKADRIVPEEDRALSVGAWLLYEYVRKECGVSAETPFNLSHSGKMVLCSIEDSGEKEIKIGCDIEEIKKLHTKLIKRYFFKSEENFILSKPSDEEKKVAFYRYWVLKESFMKATRYGMKMGLDTFEIMCDETGAKLLRQPKEICEQFYFKEYETDLPYRVAVCSTSDVFAEKMEKMDLSIYWR